MSLLRRERARKRIAVWSGIACAFVMAGCASNGRHGPTFRGAVDIDRSAFAEPSGMAFHPLRETLLVVGDQGWILEMTTSGDAIREHHVGNYDLEGVTCHPLTGHIYVVEESRDRIHELDGTTFEALRWFRVEPTFEGRDIVVTNARGLEGITFVPNASHPEGGTFFVVNQNHSGAVGIDDPSAVIELEVPLTHGAAGDVATIKNVVTPGVGDLSAIHYESRVDELFVVSDKGNMMLRMTRDGTELARWPIGGKKQEGLTIDGEGRAYLAQDKGGVLRGRWVLPMRAGAAP